VPDGVERPRPGRHAPGRVECPRRRWRPVGWGCPGARGCTLRCAVCTRGGRTRRLRCVLDDARAWLSARKEWQEDGGMHRRRIQGSAVRTYGMTGAWPRRNLGSVARTRRCRTTARCVR